MIRKILLLTTVASGLALAAPAISQDPAKPMSPPGASPSTAQTFSPGARVMASGGEALGVIDRVHVSAAGEQRLHVRTPAGVIKSVPTTGAMMHDGAVMVGWTKAEFDAAAAAPAMSGTMPAPSTPARPTPSPTSTPSSGDPDDAQDPPAQPPASPR